MAGAGYKLFNTGDVLTAAQVNTYLMEQSVMVFADAAARTTALSGVVAEGMLSYLKDTNAVEVYNGSAWVASDDPNAIQNTIVDAKGDLIAASAADTPARLAVGANGTVLTAASGETTGLKWVTPTAPANFTLLNAGGTALTGAGTITVSGISGADKILIVVLSASGVSASGEVTVRLNADSGNNYLWGAGVIIGYSTYSAGIVDRDAQTAFNRIVIGKMSTNAASQVTGYLLLSGCNSSGVKVYNGAGGASPAAGTDNSAYSIGGVYTGSSTISSISMVNTTGNFDNGTVYVYTSA